MLGQHTTTPHTTNHNTAAVHTATAHITCGGQIDHDAGWFDEMVVLFGHGESLMTCVVVLFSAAMWHVACDMCGIVTCDMLFCGYTMC